MELMTNEFLGFTAWLARQSRLFVHDEIVLSVTKDRFEEVSTAIRRRSVLHNLYGSFVYCHSCQWLRLVPRSPSLF